METETGQTRVQEEDFDLDSLLYDIVKFDPSKVVQQQTQPQQTSQPVTNNVQQEEDVPDSGDVPSVEQPSQDGNVLQCVLLICWFHY